MAHPNDQNRRRSRYSPSTNCQVQVEWLWQPPPTETHEIPLSAVFGQNEVLHYRCRRCLRDAMFILTKIADLVQIKPTQFAKLSIEAIEDNINDKYCNKVIQKIGLCICMYDLLWASEGLIGHGNGVVNVNVECRLVVFRPFKGEVLLARISRCVKEGIHLRTDFFDDIFIPFDELPEGATFNHDQSLWVWHVGDQDMYYDEHEMVRFRVTHEEWYDQTPTKPIEGGEPQDRKPPYRLTGTMKEAGLGVCLWWGEDDEGDEDYDGDDEPDAGGDGGTSDGNGSLAVGL